MTPKTYLATYGKDKTQAIAEKAGTSLDNFIQIARYNGACSARLAKKLVDASDRAMSLEEILFPKDCDFSLSQSAT